mgnify:CR=1 FL=1
MKYATSLLLAAAVPVLWTSSAPATRIAFAPEEGTTVVKTFSETTEMTLDEMSLSMNGQELDPSMMGEFEMSSNLSMTKQLTDEYISIGGGRAKKLRRTFDSLSNESSMSQSTMMGDQDVDLSGESELEGLTVVFTLDPETDEISVAFDGDEEHDAELLDGLEEDMDMRALLPTGEVEEGASWELDPSSLLTVFAPGGDLQILPDMEEFGDMGGGPNPSNDLSQILGDIDGTATATFTGTRDEDGTNVAVIEFEFDISSAKDMTEIVASMMEDPDLPDELDGVEIEVSAVDVELQYEGKGKLLWSMEQGRMHSFEFTGDMTVTTDMAMAMTGTPMGDMEQEVMIEMTGSTTLTGSVE